MAAPHPALGGTHVCDVRRYRAAHTNAQDERARIGRAGVALFAGLGHALGTGAEFLIVRFGKGALCHDIILRFVRDFVYSGARNGLVDLGETRRYPDRLVVALRKSP